MIDVNLTNKIFLKIGEIYVTAKPSVIITDLGSCVSMVFHNRRLKMSAVCHAQLPEDVYTGKHCADSCPNPCNRNFETTNQMRFLSCAVKYMVGKFEEMGVGKKEIEVGIYGGSSLSADSYFKIGNRNIEKARALVKEYKLLVVNEDLGGLSSRRLYHYTETGITEIISNDSSLYKKIG